MSTVVITGTSKGIGLETALAFGRAGFTVHATMRNPAQSPELAALAAAENLPITVWAMDVDSDQSVSSGFEAILHQAGAIDVLVNNAGIERRGPVEELPLEDFRAIMETNYFGMIRCIQAVAAQMRARQSGCIINVSSIGGRIATSPLGGYCASKWAVEALSEVLAAEMSTFNVRVAIVEPGIIDTSMARRIGDQPADASSAYGQSARFAALYEACLKNGTPPSLVAAKILEIAQGDIWQLRHPVGPDAVPFLQWRGSMSDEEYAALNGADDETWYRRVERDFGMKLKPE